MNFATFRDKTKKYPFFRSNVFPHITANVRVLRRQVSDWVNKGLIIALKRGFYTLRDEDRIAGFSSYFLANNLYTPSYISLETALSYYGMIPEQVHAITSITSKKTQHFNNNFGNFIYHHIKQELYGGFITKTDEFSNQFFIASPERAMIDFLYFKGRDLNKIHDDVFAESFRLQNLSLLNKNKLLIIAKQFTQKKLIQLIKLLVKQW